MENYELTIVIDGKATSAKKKSVSATIEKIITTNKGKLGKIQDWGVKDLAYKIGESTTGIFLHFPIELSTEAVRQIPAKLKMEDDVVRYLLVKGEQGSSKEKVKTKKANNNGKKSK